MAREEDGFITGVTTSYGSLHQTTATLLAGVTGTVMKSLEELEKRFSVSS
jgi:hypothetical protein